MGLKRYLKESKGVTLGFKRLEYFVKNLEVTL
jgi:hypothetical protein